jgi:hypothetical protein
MSGLATPEELANLQRALIVSLTKKLQQPSPSAGNLTNARQLLKDMVYMPDITGKLLKRLDALHLAYIAALEASLLDKPTAADLREAREYMRQSKRDVRNYSVVSAMPIPSTALKS